MKQRQAASHKLQALAFFLMQRAARSSRKLFLGRYSAKSQIFIE
jgi:hypothetical protein